MNTNFKRRIRQQYLDKKFLNELQNELKTQDKDHQAAPRFWAIKDYKWVSAVDGCGERVVAYDTEGSYRYDADEFINDYVECSELDDLYNEHGREKIGEFLLIDSLVEAVEFVNAEFGDNEWSYCEEQEIGFIVEDTMFLTKAEAKRHIELNRYHYTSKVHTYAMTAWRAPKTARAIRILGGK